MYVRISSPDMEWEETPIRLTDLFALRPSVASLSGQPLSFGKGRAAVLQ